MRIKTGARRRAPVPRGYVPGQTAGRSAGLPVHWPLWPAPLPPLVGGDGLAAAIGAVATESARAARTPATTLRVLFISSPFRSNLSVANPRRGHPNRTRGVISPDHA